MVLPVILGAIALRLIPIVLTGARFPTSGPCGTIKTVVLTACAIVLLVGCGGSRRSSPATPKPTAIRQTTTASVLTHLKQSGLPIAEVQTYDAKTDPHHLLDRPGQYVGKAAFHDGRLQASPTFGVDGGGSVEVFEDEAAAQQRATVLQKGARSSSLLAEYDYARGVVLRRVSHLLTPGQAKAYETALQTFTA
jgi:hypothetical protein